MNNQLDRTNHSQQHGHHNRFHRQPNQGGRERQQQMPVRDNRLDTSNGSVAVGGYQISRGTLLMVCKAVNVLAIICLVCTSVLVLGMLLNGAMLIGNVACGGATRDGVLGAVLLVAAWVVGVFGNRSYRWLSGLVSRRGR